MNSQEAPHFQMRQCERATCRFRFPVQAGTDEGAVCPVCGAGTALVTMPFAGRRTGETARRGPALAALLDNIRSTFNVGAMMRTADGAGLRHLHLCGITATPAHPGVAKTALGAETAIPWSYHRNGVDAARMLRDRGCQLWALESHEGASSLFKTPLPVAGDSQLVLVVGNERAGVDPGILGLCERIVHIPMQGTKESLNVAIAFGIAAYTIRFGDL